MTLRVTVLFVSLLSLLASAQGAPAQEAETAFVRRGLYFTSAVEGIAFWVPGWVNKSDQPRAGMTAEFGIMVMNRFIQMYVMVSGQTLEEILERQRSEAATTFQGGSLEVIEPLGGCTRPAVVALFTGIDAAAGFADKDFLVAATRLDPAKSVTFHLLTAKGQGKAVLPVVRWMVDSLGPAGEAGLADRGGPRRIDPEAALSYRLPPGLAAVDRPAAAGPDAAGGVLVSACGETGGEADGQTLTVTAGTEEALAELQSRAEAQASLRLIRRPHPDGEARLIMACLPPEADATTARVQAYVVADGKPPLRVEVIGPVQKRETLIDHAELTAASLRRVDVDATRTAALAAAAELPKAARANDAVQTRELVTQLIAGAFLPAARAALVGSLPLLAEDEQVRAVDALAASGDAAAAAPLVSLYRSAKTKKRPAVKTALLRALGRLPDPAARRLLIDEIRARDAELAAVAIRALGHGRAWRAETIPALLSQFKREETGGRSKNRPNRERWGTLRPAYETTLERLTGEAFGSAQDAQEWYRKHKSDL